MDAAQRWADDLASWALPDRLLAQAEDDPWALPVELFAREAHESMTRATPSRDRALEALPAGGSVLDVGCGGGAASMALSTKPGFVTGIDESEGMLVAFDELATERGIQHSVVKGRWPDVAASVERHDLVVCHHVFYNVPDLVAFAGELTAHANRRVVVEMTGEHPRSWTNPLFELFHGLARPEKPTAEDALEIVRSLGVDAHIQIDRRPSLFALNRDLVAPWIRRTLCLPAARETEVAAALERYPPPLDRRVATLWWDP